MYYTATALTTNADAAISGTISATDSAAVAVAAVASDTVITFTAVADSGFVVVRM